MNNVDYPMGADDLSAPWNQPIEEDPELKTFEVEVMFTHKFKFEDVQMPTCPEMMEVVKRMIKSGDIIADDMEIWDVNIEGE